MRTLVEKAVPGARPKLLIALLCGTYSEPEDLAREGFASAVGAHGIDAEIALAQMRAAWFADGSVVRRIRESVVEPARARGIERIWLGGISLGALACLCYAARHESDLDGIVLISPYPATREVLREMDEAGGLGQWKPLLAPDGDLEREAWMWLGASREGRLPVHCYFGSEDRFAEGQRRIAGTLPRERVREMPGGHDWDAWRRLWDAFLSDASAVPR
jgi:pimeloyl-ACP methyl ester carboxylesterase